MRLDLYMKADIIKEADSEYLRRDARHREKGSYSNEMDYSGGISHE